MIFIEGVILFLYNKGIQKSFFSFFELRGVEMSDVRLITNVNPLFEAPKGLLKFRQDQKRQEHEMWNAIKALAKGSEMGLDMAAHQAAGHRDYRRMVHVFEAPYHGGQYHYMLDIHDLALRGLLNPLVGWAREVEYFAYFSFRLVDIGKGALYISFLLDQPKGRDHADFYAWDNMKDVCGYYYKVAGALASV